MTLTELLQHLGLSKNGTLKSSNGNINIYIYILMRKMTINIDQPWFFSSPMTHFVSEHLHELDRAGVLQSRNSPVMHNSVNEEFPQCSVMFSCYKSHRRRGKLGTDIPQCIKILYGKDPGGISSNRTSLNLHFSEWSKQVEGHIISLLIIKDYSSR